MILLRNSLVVDGTGAEPRRVDILLKDNRITAIGFLQNQDADLVIDGLGMMTTPGFIDVNTDSDHYLSLFSDPAQQDFLLQGVTTIIGGMCGSSLAPLLYGTLESIRKWGDVNQINVDWNTLSEFFAVLGRIKLGVNFGTLVGHSTIRRAIVGRDSRDLTVKELEVFEEIVKQALKEGALGLSTGLAYSHSKLTPYDEIKRLVKLVVERGGVYATHLRDEHEEIEKAVEETIKLTKELGANTLVSHFRPIKGFEVKFEKALTQIENAGKNGANIHFDAYPFNYSILPLYTLLPEWAKTGKSLEQMMDQFTDESEEAEISKELPNFKGDELIVARAPGFDYLIGKTIGEFAKKRNLPPRKALVELMKITKLHAVMFYKNINLSVVQNALRSDRALIASNSPSLLEQRGIIENDRAKKTFSEYIKLFRDFKETTLQWAIQKITQNAAKKFNLKDRGVIKEGAIADLVMFKDSKAVHVFVSGKQVVKDSALTGERAGVILKS